MAGYRVLGVLKKTMEYKTRFDRDTIVKRFKNHGFSDELANLFADAYTADDISVARNYLDSKVASNRQKSVEDGRNEWLENTTKSNKAKTPKNQDEILKEISSDKTQFKLIDDSDMTPELKSRLENDEYTLEREPESGVWEVSKAISDQEIKRAENTQENSKILTNQDIKEQISKWDLNAPKQTLITNKIDGEELEKLNEHFKFKGNYPLTRQIDSEHIKHALNHHGDEKIEALRGQKAITLDDISNYENYAKTADIKEYSDKKVISKKQIRK